MKELGNKPLCLPQPVFMIGTYDKDKNPNLMNAAWGGISYDDEITICLANDHKTTDNLKLKGVNKNQKSIKKSHKRLLKRLRLTLTLKTSLKKPKIQQRNQQLMRRNQIHSRDLANGAKVSSRSSKKSHG